MKKYIFLALLTMGVSSCQLVDVLDQKPCLLYTSDAADE